MQLFQDQKLAQVNYTLDALPKGEYESCSFMNCDFSNCNLSGYIFIDCAFKGCNLSLVKLGNTILRDIVFKDCKMIGMQFCDANTFGFSVAFEQCILTNASFFKMNSKKTKFVQSKLNEVDFTESDLTASVFRDCDLSGALFSFSNLEQVDFRSAVNYSIDPEKNKLKKSKHSMVNLSGLLDKYQLVIE
jgi:uncharacterized protein YjbI with pentapeptide repeats